MSTTTHTTAAEEQEILAINASYNTEAAKEEAAKQLADAFERPETKTEALKEIENLASTIRGIARDFVSVRADLRRFDEKQFKDENNNVLKLADEWDDYRKQFEDHVNKSRVTAQKASAFLQQYSAAVLTDPQEYTFKELLKELKTFSKNTEDHQKEAFANQSKFSDLALKIRAFVKHVQDTLAKAEEVIKRKIEDLGINLKSAKEKLVGIEQRISALVKATATTLAVGAAAGVAALVFLAPAAGLVALGFAIAGISTGIKLANAKKEKTQAEAEIRKLVQELKDEQAKLDWLRDYMANMGDTYATMESIAKRVDVISSIWLNIQMDMVNISEQVGSVADPDTALTKRWTRRLDATRGAYKTLAVMLDKYARNAVDPSTVTA